ncbi:MAG: ImmA/IrrE family metallo-endopeptidase [Clostridia bacterium]
MLELTKICKTLKIKPPKVVCTSDTKKFDTATTIAVSDIKSYTIFLNNNFLPKTNFDEIFTIAHECRHFWQFKNNKFNFDAHLQSNNASKTIYNNQPEELDAHAFACAYIMKNFHVMPLFNGFDEKIKDSILIEAKKIILKEFL